MAKGNATGQAGPPRPPRPPTVPAKPKMGFVIQAGSEFVAVVGGKPTPDWSGLQDEAGAASCAFPAADAISPMRHRAAGAGIGYLQRTTGLVPAFTERAGADFGAFAARVQQHLERTGMDTIAYVRDPNDPRRVASCVTDHSRFDPAKMRELLKGRARLYDSYDRWNDDDATRFLLASVSKKLRDTVRAKAQGEPFAQHFAELVDAVRSIAPSSRPKAVPRRKAASRAGALMAAIGAVQPPDDCTWHHIEEVRKAVMPMVNELLACREFKHAVTRTLAFNLLAAEKTNEQCTYYKNAINAFLNAHEEGLRAIAFMRKRDKDPYMTHHNLMPKDLFDVACQSCHQPRGAPAPQWPSAGGHHATWFPVVSSSSASAPFAPNSDPHSQDTASDALLLQGMLSQYSNPG
jgi:hypothetical protein